MPQWSDDLSERTLEEIVRFQRENQDWYTQLRLHSAALVNRRLAKQISLEDYASQRDVARTDAAECRRRGDMLAEEISVRKRELILAVPGMPQRTQTKSNDDD